MPEEPFAPRSVGGTSNFDVTGYLFAWDAETEQPVVVTMYGTLDLFIPLFSSIEKLKALYEDIKIEYSSVKAILDAREFLLAIPRETDGINVHVIADPYRHESGTIRYKQLARN